MRLTNPNAHIVYVQDKNKPWEASEKVAEDFGVTICSVQTKEVYKAIGQDYRYHYLPSVMRHLALRNVWHLEYDNMIYTNFTTITKVASTLYSEVVAVPLGARHGDNPGLYMTAGIMFLKDWRAAEAFRRIEMEFVNARIGTRYNDKNKDMVDLANIQKTRGTIFLANLPILPAGPFSEHARDFESRAATASTWTVSIAVLHWVDMIRKVLLNALITLALRS